jgi:hypothetical protein
LAQTGAETPNTLSSDKTAMSAADGAVGTKMAKAINPVKLIAVSAAAGRCGFTKRLRGLATGKN